MHSFFNLNTLYMIKKIILSLFGVLLVGHAVAQSEFCIARQGTAAPIIVDDADWKGVVRAANDLGDDVRKVTGVSPKIIKSRKSAKHAIIAGTIGKSRLINGLIAKKKIDVSQVRGQWESYLIDVVDGSLVIAGSDKRGTIYGIYEISRQIGVSPWYWWADVPVQHRDSLFYQEGRVVQPSPKVKYRGIFINDEWPSFGEWTTNKFGGQNSKVYTRMFELLLRLKANYLWPAMWNSMFNEDDPLNPAMADEYGIVMGTSHHEPMMRAHKEYTSRREEVGPWDYAVNKQRLDKFFRDGMERNKAYENLVTIGMRGDGDVAMGKGDDADNIKTLGKVIEGQRQIIKDIYGRPDAVPQLWAIFTEVQRYYDAGFNVPDDVTLLFCDNNWGYVRRTGPESERQRKGGMGLYYHIDMNGGPWNDRWVNTSPIPKLREQLNLAYQSGLDRIWIINVGDLKPKELPIDFIMHYAWNPDAVQPGDERGYVHKWAASIFGDDLAEEVTDILVKYPKYNLWRKAEVQVPGIFSADHWNEAERVTLMWRQLAEQAEALRLRVPAEMQDAYYQLVYYPAVASAGVAEIYNCATMNSYYAQRGDMRANAYADRAKQLYVKDSLLTAYYNQQLAGGKWQGMMQDKHMGYREWFMPQSNELPHFTYVSADDAQPSVATPPTVSDEYAIEAIHYSRITAADGVTWRLLPDLGRKEGCMGASNVTAASAPVGSGARLEYDIDVDKTGLLKVAIGILPTQDVNPERGLRLAVQLDNDSIQVLDARRGLVDTFLEYTPDNLARSSKLKPLPAPGTMALNGYRKLRRNEVFDNIRWLDVTFKVASKGKHIFKLIMVDPELVIERLIVNPDDSCYSYFGSPEKNPN